MRLPISVKFFALSLIGIVLFSVGSAFAAGLSIPYSNIDQKSIPVTADDLKPTACAGLSLTNIISGSGVITGTSGNDLIIGSPGTDIIDGLDGDDCIVSASGDDSVDGNAGTDVCLAISGTDTFANCENGGS